MQLDSPFPKIFVVIERIARAVTQWGLECEKIILEINHHIDYAPIKSSGNKNVLEVERSNFLKSSDHPYHEFYRKSVMHTLLNTKMDDSFPIT